MNWPDLALGKILKTFNLAYLLLKHYKSWNCGCTEARSWVQTQVLEYFHVCWRSFYIINSLGVLILFCKPCEQVILTERQTNKCSQGLSGTRILVCARLARLVRSLTTNQKVPGSIPDLVEGWTLGDFLSPHRPWTGTLSRWSSLSTFYRGT